MGTPKKLEKKRLQPQCVLMNAPEIFQDRSDFNREAWGTYEGKTEDEQKAAIVKGKFNNLSVLTGNIQLLINEMVSKKNMNSVINEITPAQMASLVPKIRLYVVKHNSTGKTVPFEVAFPDHVDPYSVDKILQDRKGRVEGSGIKDISFDFYGTNMAETNKMIKCKIKYYFASMQDVFEVRKMKEDLEHSFADLIMYGTQTVATKNALLTQSGTFHHRVRLVVGWNLPTGPILKELFDDSPKLKETLKKLNMEMFLGLISHNIVYKEDGTVEIDAEYQAAIEGALVSQDADVLNLSDVAIMEAHKDFEELFDIFEAAKELQKHLQQQKIKIENVVFSGESLSSKPSYNDTPNTTSVSVRTHKDIEIRNFAKLVERIPISFGLLRRTGKNLYFKSIDEILSAIQNEIDKERKKYKGEVYSAFLRRLYSSNKIYKAIVSDPVVLDIYKNKDDDDKDDELKKVLKINDNNVEVKQIVTGKTGNEAHFLLNNKMKNEAKKVDASNVKEFVNNRMKVGKDAVEIPFVYFGDFLDLCFSSYNPKEKKVRFFLGTLSYENPIDGITKSVSLAYLPISLGLLETWFFEYVVAREKQKYYLKTLIRDVVTTMIKPILGSECVSDKPNDNLVTVGLEHIVVPGRKHYGGWGQYIPTDTNEIDISMMKIAKFDEDVSESNDAEALEHRWTYIVLYVNSIASDTLWGNEKEDEDKGIHHFRLAQDTGFLKKVTFQKTTQQYLPEARVESEGTLDAHQLRDKYDADVVLYGLPIFRPGQYIYVDPTVLGVPSEHLDTLGIGGYYMVINVANNLSRDRYETTLKGVWQTGADLKRSRIQALTSENGAEVLDNP